MEKVTIQHYLNKRLKPSPNGDLLEYPVYVRVSYGRKNERLKSEWIIHPCSDFDFENNKGLLDLIEYEAKIIRFIFEIKKDGSFNLSSRLSLSTDSVTQHYLGWVLDSNEIVKAIIVYISDKTGLSEGILNPYVRIELCGNEWLELANKNIFTKDTSDRVVYFSMLLDFEKEFYPYTVGRYGYVAAVELVYYLWEKEGGKEKFCTYAKARGLLSIDTLNQITELFDKCLYSTYTFDLAASRHS